MKAINKHLARFISLAAVSLVAVSTSQASTIPASIFKFSAKATDDVFTVRAKGWRDPLFGDMGWTHSSDWGTVRVLRGQTVTIKTSSVDTGIHPGITVWYRGKDDTAPDNYVVDHFYPQNANFTKFGATDETTGAKLGDIVMRHVTHAYDKDGNTRRVLNMNPIRDRIPGQLELKFTASRTGLYMFVVGGFNPDAGVDTAVSHDVNVKVTVTGP